MNMLRDNLKLILKIYNQKELANLCNIKDRSVFSKFISEKTDSLSFSTIYSLSKGLMLNIDDLCNKKLILKFQFEEVSE